MSNNNSAISGILVGLIIVVVIILIVVGFSGSDNGGHHGHHGHHGGGGGGGGNIKVGGCESTRWGCCSGSNKAKRDHHGSNC